MPLIGRGIPSARDIQIWDDVPATVPTRGMESRGKGGGVGLRVTEIETAADGLGRSEIFHIVKEILGFVLYMHHQIPS